MQKTKNKNRKKKGIFNIFGSFRLPVMISDMCTYTYQSAWKLRERNTTWITQLKQLMEILGMRQIWVRIRQLISEVASLSGRFQNLLVNTLFQNKVLHHQFNFRTCLSIKFQILLVINIINFDQSVLVNQI